jgi:hypothetical protein
MELVSSKVGSLFNLIIPYNINLDKVRMGRDKDGGYIVPKNILADALLSYGIGDDISFEVEYINTFHKPVYGFDKHLKLKSCDPLLTLIQQPITVNCGIKEHIKQFSLEDKNLAVKMDIEHDEWEVLNCTDFDNIAYIVVELHGLLSRPQKHELMKNVLKKINKHFICVHVHGNNYGSMLYSEKIYFPDVLEVLYVSKKQINLMDEIIRGNAYFPTSFDKPNNPMYPDIPCYWWRLTEPT